MLPLRVGAYEVAVKYITAVFFSYGSCGKTFHSTFPICWSNGCCKQVLFLIILANFTNGKLETADLQNKASQLKVTPYDSGEKTENNFYALNQIIKCKTAPENLEVSKKFLTRNQCNSLQSQIPEWTMALRLWRRFKNGCLSCRDNNRLNDHSFSMQNQNGFQLLPT